MNVHGKMFTHCCVGTLCVCVKPRQAFLLPGGCWGPRVAGQTNAHEVTGSAADVRLVQSVAGGALMQ